MVKHIVLFTFKEGIDKDASTEFVASLLEPLVGRIPGLLRLEVRRNFVGPDFTLYSEVEDRDALKVYAEHPLHIAAKDQFFPMLADRVCADYEV